MQLVLEELEDIEAPISDAEGLALMAMFFAGGFLVGAGIGIAVAT